MKRSQGFNPGFFFDTIIKNREWSKPFPASIIVYLILYL
jgi:hypothetical protein